MIEINAICVKIIENQFFDIRNSVLCQKNVIEYMQMTYYQ